MIETNYNIVIMQVCKDISIQKKTHLCVHMLFLWSAYQNLILHKKKSSFSIASENIQLDFLRFWGQTILESNIGIYPSLTIEFIICGDKENPSS